MRGRTKRRWRRGARPGLSFPGLFREEDYKAVWQAPMTRIIDDWGLRYPGVKNVEHVYFYAMSAADEKTRRSYLERAHILGKEFAKN